MTHIDSIIGALVGVPSLPGAKCRGRGHLFDEPQHGESRDAVQQRHQQSLLLCSQCPASGECAKWLEGLSPRHKPFGVIAGRVRTRRKKQTPDEPTTTAVTTSERKPQ